MILSGVRVIEVGHAVAGPTAGLILADLGAEVIKVERPGSGDHFRDLPGMGSSMFVDLNRGKKSVAIDLSDPRGYEIFLRLVSISDVVIDNLDPGASRRLGISYEALSRVNPRIIYCKITGFGEGPYGDLPAYDPMLQAASGIMSVTGFPPDGFVRAGISLVDMSGAFHCVIGVLASLYRRASTGFGSYIEVSLFDAAVYYMGYWITYYDLYGRDPEPLGSTHIFGAPYGLFRVSDGYVYIAIVSDKHWREFCEALGFIDLLEDARFRSNHERVRHKKELEEEIGRRLSRYSVSELMEILGKRGVPIAPLHRVSTLLKDSHLAYRKIVDQVIWGGKPLRVALNPIKIDGERPSARGNPPLLGANTLEILTKILGFSVEEAEKLRSEGIVSWP
ncbi:MAG: CaiB/BaiF CoA-transferase family protein [Sulfolobales archaeon]